MFTSKFKTDDDDCYKVMYDGGDDDNASEPD
jgi:hypothetical protein